MNSLIWIVSFQFAVYNKRRDICYKWCMMQLNAKAVYLIPCRSNIWKFKHNCWRWTENEPTTCHYRIVSLFLNCNFIPNELIFLMFPNFRIRKLKEELNLTCILNEFKVFNSIYVYRAGLKLRSRTFSHIMLRVWKFLNKDELANWNWPSEKALVSYNFHKECNQSR